VTAHLARPMQLYELSRMYVSLSLICIGFYNLTFILMNLNTVLHVLCVYMLSTKFRLSCLYVPSGGPVGVGREGGRVGGTLAGRAPDHSCNCLEVASSSFGIVLQQFHIFQISTFRYFDTGNIVTRGT
jgi:hypothetical protein